MSHNQKNQQINHTSDITTPNTDGTHNVQKVNVEDEKLNSSYTNIQPGLDHQTQPQSIIYPHNYNIQPHNPHHQQHHQLPPSQHNFQTYQQQMFQPPLIPQQHLFSQPPPPPPQIQTLNLIPNSNQFISYPANTIKQQPSLEHQQQISQGQTYHDNFLHNPLRGSSHGSSHFTGGQNQISHDTNSKADSTLFNQEQLQYHKAENTLAHKPPTEIPSRNEDENTPINKDNNRAAYYQYPSQIPHHHPVPPGYINQDPYNYLLPSIQPMSSIGGESDRNMEFISSSESTNPTASSSNYNFNVPKIPELKRPTYFSTSSGPTRSSASDSSSGSISSSTSGLLAPQSKKTRKRKHTATVSDMTPETAERNRCRICNKQFKRPSSLQTHYYSHTGEKIFKCEWEGCGKLFSVKSNMTRHYRLHERDNNKFNGDRINPTQSLDPNVLQQEQYHQNQTLATSPPNHFITPQSSQQPASMHYFPAPEATSDSNDVKDR